MPLFEKEMLAVKVADFRVVENRVWECFVVRQSLVSPVLRKHSFRRVRVKGMTANSGAKIKMLK